MLKINFKVAENILGKASKKTALKTVQQLMDIWDIEDNIIKNIDKGKYFIKVAPKNINIIQSSVLMGIIDSFKTVCNIACDFEILCVDKVERMEDNLNFLMSQESATDNLLYKKILKSDIEMIRHMQSGGGASREFYIVIQFDDIKKSKELIRRVERVIQDQGFDVLHCSRLDMQNMLQVYFERNFSNQIVGDPLGIHAFTDLIAPSILKFYPDYFVFGNTYRRVYVVRNYPMDTDRLALLRKFGEHSNITLKIYARKMGNRELEKSIESSVNKNMSDTTLNQFVKSTQANHKLDATHKLVNYMYDNPNEMMFGVTVFVEVIGNSYDEMVNISDDVITKLDGITYDALYMQQKEGFIAVNPAGKNVFTPQFEQHMPSSSLANLFPFSYSGCTDKEGDFLGYDKHGGNIIVDFNKRDDSHGNSNILILGNSGEGKTTIGSLVQLNIAVKEEIVNKSMREKINIIGLDPEHEYEDVTNNLGGVFIDLLAGSYIINLLEPKKFSDKEDLEDDDIKTFAKDGVLSQHISFLRDFFKTYKNFDEVMLDALEIMIQKTYERFGIGFETDLSGLDSKKFPILSDLYNTIDAEYKGYDDQEYHIFTKDMLQALLLGLNSICNGADAQYFNGHTNIKSYRYVTFGVKSLLEASSSLKNAMLFNILSYMSNKLLVEGNTVAFIDELYLFLDNPVLIKYIRNFAKRVRKRNSAVVMISQNVEDFLHPDVVSLTKPLFSIPTFRFLFYPGEVKKSEFMDVTNITDSEYDLIKSPHKGNCLFISGRNRYNLSVYVPEYKLKLFGDKRGR